MNTPTLRAARERALALATAVLHESPLVPELLADVARDELAVLWLATLLVGQLGRSDGPTWDELHAFVDALQHVDPAARPRSASAFVQALQGVVGTDPAADRLTALAIALASR